MAYTKSADGIAKKVRPKVKTSATAAPRWGFKLAANPVKVAAVNPTST